MRAPAAVAEVLRSPVAPKREPRSEPRHELGDLRFRALMTEAEWLSLPLAIRRRFSKRLAGGQTLVYAGEILQTRTSWAGWGLAQAAPLIGAPLPLTRDPAARSAPAPHRPAPHAGGGSRGRGGGGGGGGGRGGGRQDRAPPLCAPKGISAGHPFVQALRRSDWP